MSAEIVAEKSPHWRIYTHGGTRGKAWRLWGRTKHEEKARKWFGGRCNLAKQGGVRLVSPAGELVDRLWKGWRTGNQSQSRQPRERTHTRVGRKRDYEQGRLL